MIPNASRRVKSYFAPTLTDFKVGSKHRDFTPAKLGKLDTTVEGSPMIDTKNVKQKFLAGDKEVVCYYQPEVP